MTTCTRLPTDAVHRAPIAPFLFPRMAYGLNGVDHPIVTGHTPRWLCF